MSLHARLSQICKSIQSYDSPRPRLPVIDSSSSHGPDNKHALPGLRLLREEVKRDCELLREHASFSTASTNAPYLIAVWDELVHASEPVAIYRTFPLRDDAGKPRTTPQAKKALKPQTRQIKVDIVAENGARWLRVNTIKNSRLMMEFREIDSYLTSDEEADELPQLAQVEFDNSVLRMARDLLAAAKANPVSVPCPDLDSNAPSPESTIIPQVTIRFTRLDPRGDAPDPRIEKTIRSLRDMGIDVQLGERPSSYPVPTRDMPTQPKLAEPTTNINLDLSALIALISDTSHLFPPRTEEEAHARYAPPQSYLDWKKDRVKSLARQSQMLSSSLYDTGDDGHVEDTWVNSGQHSRALAAQAVQEMNKGILQEIHEHLSAVALDPLVTSPSVTFWTTSEARHRCLQIVSKISGEKERQRADALLGSMICARTPPISRNPKIDGISATTPGAHDVDTETSAQTYWEHSRYPAGFLPLTPVSIYSSILPTVINGGPQSGTSFFDMLARTCTRILSHEAVSLRRTSLPSNTLSTTESMLKEIPPAMQTSLPKLTVHTVRSMLAGASRGHTTLTTNRSSVKAVLKEMQRVYGRGGHEPGIEDVEKAALWILDPRSMSEGMCQSTI